MLFTHNRVVKTPRKAPRPVVKIHYANDMVGFARGEYATDDYRMRYYKITPQRAEAMERIFNTVARESGATCNMIMFSVRLVLFLRLPKDYQAGEVGYEITDPQPYD